MITFLMLLTNVLSTSAGDVFITRGMKQVGEISTLRLRTLLGIAVRVLSNTDFLAGVLCMAVSFFSFLAVLSRADMSFVVPITSLAYAVSTIGAKFILKERVNPLRWAGTLLVCVGAALVSLP
jgi:drug/metabolite transporter (DMT)-like permease